METGGELARLEAADAVASEWWERVWSHRERLLQVARRRAVSKADAEDAVHEAMLRAAERPGLDDDRLGAWLTTVTMRLCVDRFRQVNREAALHHPALRITAAHITMEEAVCDRAEAQWLVDRSSELPARQKVALSLQMQGLGLNQIAQRMGLSYGAVQSLVARARRTLRAALAGTLGAIALLWRGALPGVGREAHTASLAAWAAAVSVTWVGVLLPCEVDAAPVPRLPTYGTALPAASDQAPSPLEHSLPGGAPASANSGSPTSAPSSQVRSHSLGSGPARLSPPDLTAPSRSALPDTPALHRPRTPNTSELALSEERPPDGATVSMPNIPRTLVIPARTPGDVQQSGVRQAR